MKNKKVITMVTVASVMGALTIGGTLAWLTHTTDEVVNTFTVNTVGGDIDEEDTDNSTDGEERDKENTYDMVPGKSELKDPTVHMYPSETTQPSYVFVKVKEVMDDESEYKFSDYITYSVDAGKGWMKVDGSAVGQAGLYYQLYDPATDGEVHIGILTEVDTDRDGTLDAQGITYNNTITNEMMKALIGKEIPELRFKMDVIQAEGFKDVQEAAKELGLIK